MKKTCYAFKIGEHPKWEKKKEKQIESLLNTNP